MFRLFEAAGGPGGHSTAPAAAPDPPGVPAGLGRPGPGPYGLGGLAGAASGLRYIGNPVASYTGPIEIPIGNP